MMQTRVDRLKQVLVLGAGYGGLRSAMRLAGLLRGLPGYRVALVDANNHHQLMIQLHEVAGGRTPAGALALPLERLLGSRGIEFHQARVSELDLAGHRVITDRGELPYHRLVVALGSVTNFYGIPGLREHSFTLKSLRDACLIRAHMGDMFDRASFLEQPQERQAALTFVVGGGGFTGTELAAELMEAIPDLARERGISPREAKVVVLEASDGLLPGLDRRLASRAAHSLRQMGVEILFGSPAQEADAHGIVLQSGQRIETRTIIWTGGVKAPEMLARFGLPTGAAGRVRVDAFLRAEGHPEVYVVGDSALVLDARSGRPAAPSAQLAVKEAEAAAWNLYADFTGRELRPYGARVTGEAISLGARDGVAWMGPLRVAGLPARWLKRFIANRYLLEVGGLTLLRTYSTLGRATFGQDFPECILEYHPQREPKEVLEPTSY
jgi:NADH dehydrogenase